LNIPIGQKGSGQQPSGNKEEQKQLYLPRFARGEISAFALTEPSVGSDPATMETTAEPTEDGRHYVINGEKLWCTNGTRAGVIIVMAKTPPKTVRGKTKNQITAFIVEMNSPGVEVTHRCRFMGLKALYNAVIRFHNVRVPKENIICDEGKGLNVALTTLNTGRLTLPAACVGLARRCLQIARQWANERVQWGAPIGHHAAIADKLSCMAARLFVMESMVLLASSRVEQDKNADIRLEAAMCKLWATEAAWQIVNDTMQIRGGRGYETADSLRNRGEPGIGVERFLRDVRINTIFEGSSEIMRLFLAREALDKHLKIGGPVMNSQLPGRQRLQAALLAGRFYSLWYPGLWWPSGAKFNGGATRPFNRHLRYVARSSRRLSRSLFHAMIRTGPKLQREQLLLGRFVDIGSELFAMSAACSRAQSLLDQGTAQEQLPELVDLFCRSSRLRVEHLFHEVRHNTDRPGYRMARKILDGRLEWLETGRM
jgi:alkylation response protein AidB-like acyl-CoA dehydrogenase